MSPTVGGLVHRTVEMLIVGSQYRWQAGYPRLLLRARRILECGQDRR